MLNAAIVGLGWWGKTLVRAAKATGEIAIVAGATGTRANAEDYSAEQGFRLHDDLAAVLADPQVEAVLLATPHLDHDDHVVAAAAAGKAIFIEKPFTMTKAGAERAIAAVQAAGVPIALGHNRRFHPHMTELRRRIADGGLGTILHVEGTMTAPNGLFLKPESWRSNPAQSPAGGMSGLGIHMVDGMIDLVGQIHEVTAQAIHRATPSGSKDTTSVLITFADEGGTPGPTGFVSCMTATAPYYRFCVYGSKGVAEIRGQGLDHFSFWPTPDAPLGGHATPKPVETSEIKGYDTVVAELAAFAAAVAGGPAYPVTHAQMIHGSAVFEAIATSAATGTKVTVPR
jgi:predicted dehydrogenase